MTSKVLHALLTEAHHTAATFAGKSRGMMSQAEYARFRVVAPYLLHPVKPPHLIPLNADERPLGAVAGLPVNRDYKPIGAPNKYEDFVDYDEFPLLFVPDSPQLRLVLDSDMSLFSDGSAPWKSRKHAAAYARRLDCLIDIIARGGHK